MTSYMSGFQSISAIIPVLSSHQTMPNCLRASLKNAAGLSIQYYPSLILNT